MKAFGFTMIELVLVIAFVGIIGVSFVVSHADIPNSTIEAAALKVMNDIEHAKQNAMSSGVISGISFTQDGTYTVYQETSSTPLENPLDRQPFIIDISSSYPNISLGNSAVVEFDSIGAVSQGGGSTITLRSGALTRVIEINANTGLVRMQ